MKRQCRKLCVGIGGESIRFLNLRIAGQIVSGTKMKDRYIVVDTDGATLMCAWAPTRLQLGGPKILGLGTGGDIEAGRTAAEESREILLELFKKEAESMKEMCLYAGLHGGTALGATPVICALAKSAGLQTTLNVVTDGNELTEKENRILAEWRNLVDELDIIMEENRLQKAEKILCTP